MTDPDPTITTEAEHTPETEIEPETVIETTGVSKTFGDGGVLENVDLRILADETTLLMGPNGSGKTVLLACLAGGLHPSTGEISVFNTSPSAARAELSFMLQGGLALPDLSGRENIEFYADLHPGATDDWRELADRLDLTDDLDRRVKDYSGGMIRKLELVITMSVDVPLYLLDEPVSELDLTTIDQFHALVGRKRERGNTVVISSHTPADIEIADRIVFMQQGRVATDGEPDALLDAVPPVVRVAGQQTAVDVIREHIHAGRFFESDVGRRGFLDGSERVIEKYGDGVGIDDPTWTDMFNYYVHIVPDDLCVTST